MAVANMPPVPFFQEPLQRRHDERRRLAGPGFGARDQIAAGKGERNDRRLDGSRLRVGQILQPLCQPGIETQGSIRHGLRIAHECLERRGPRRHGRRIRWSLR
jgi:hypothetical protein